MQWKKNVCARTQRLCFTNTASAGRLAQDVFVGLGRSIRFGGEHLWTHRCSANLSTSTPFAKPVNAPKCPKCAKEMLSSGLTLAPKNQSPSPSIIFQGWLPKIQPACFYWAHSQEKDEKGARSPTSCRKGLGSQLGLSMACGS